jgi:hypothetical protein
VRRNHGLGGICLWLGHIPSHFWTSRKGKHRQALEFIPE